MMQRVARVRQRQLILVHRGSSSSGIGVRPTWCSLTPNTNPLLFWCYREERNLQYWRYTKCDFNFSNHTYSCFIAHNVAVNSCSVFVSVGPSYNLLHLMMLFHLVFQPTAVTVRLILWVVCLCVCVCNVGVLWLKTRTGRVVWRIVHESYFVLYFDLENFRLSSPSISVAV